MPEPKRHSESDLDHTRTNAGAWQRAFIRVLHHAKSVTIAIASTCGGRNRRAVAASQRPRVLRPGHVLLPLTLPGQSTEFREPGSETRDHECVGRGERGREEYRVAADVAVLRSDTGQDHARRGGHVQAEL